MASRPAARAGFRGGAAVPALRSTTIRLIIGAAAAILEAAVGGLLILRSPLLRNLIGLLAVLAVMTLIGGLVWRRSAPLAWSIVLMGTAFGLSLIGEPQSIAATSLLVAAALFLAAEVAYLAIEEEVYAAIPMRPLLASLALAAGSVTIGVLILATGPSVLVAGPVVTAAGVAATLVLLFLVIAAAARRAHP